MRLSSWQAIASSCLPPQSVDDTKVIQAGGFTLNIAQLAADGEAVLLKGDRLCIPPQQPGEDAKVVQGMRLGG